MQDGELDNNDTGPHHAAQSHLQPGRPAAATGVRFKLSHKCMLCVLQVQKRHAAGLRRLQKACRQQRFVAMPLAAHEHCHAVQLCAVTQHGTLTAAPAWANMVSPGADSGCSNVSLLKGTTRGVAACGQLGHGCVEVVIKQKAKLCSLVQCQLPVKDSPTAINVGV
mgnify:CR=1 FL=1